MILKIDGVSSDQLGALHSALAMDWNFYRVKLDRVLREPIFRLKSVKGNLSSEAREASIPSYGITLEVTGRLRGEVTLPSGNVEGLISLSYLAKVLSALELFPDDLSPSESD